MNPRPLFLTRFNPLEMNTRVLSSVYSGSVMKAS